MKIHILSPGFDTANSRGFLYPFVVWRDALADAGYECKLYRADTAGLADCDVLLVDSKYHRDDWQDRTAETLGLFRLWTERCRVIYCDTTDSSGWLQSDLLPIVHRYAKAQLLKNRTEYLRPMYGQRPYADYYHRKFGVTDDKPAWSSPAGDREALGKLRLSWNSGLADYSLYGPLRAEVYRRLPLPGLLRFPDILKAPGAPRQKAVSCRFGISYPRESVAYQRRRIRELVGGKLDTHKVGRRGYFAELCDSKVVVSPFGYGEITLKDFEVFLSGGLLLKADMSHMETWPDLFVGGETMLAHSWDLADFVATLERAVDGYADYRALAEAGQDRYRAHTSGPEAAAKFVSHFGQLVAP